MAKRENATYPEFNLNQNDSLHLANTRLEILRDAIYALQCNLRDKKKSPKQALATAKLLRHQLNCVIDGLQVAADVANIDKCKHVEKVIVASTHDSNHIYTHTMRCKKCGDYSTERASR